MTLYTQSMCAYESVEDILLYYTYNTAVPVHVNKKPLVMNMCACLVVTLLCCDFPARAFQH